MERMKLFFKKKCDHKDKMFPVSDCGWMVGFMCDCGYFEPRKNIGTHEERLFEKYSLKTQKEENGKRLIL